MGVRVIEGGALAPQAAMAQAAQAVAQGAQAVLVQRVDVDGDALHWLHSPHACGWVRVPCAVPAAPAAALEREWQAWRGRGFVAADAALLALTPQEGGLPALSWDAQPPAMAPASGSPMPATLGIYAIVDSVPRLRQVLQAGIRTVQLRIKTPRDADAHWHGRLRQQLQEGIAAAEAAGALLFINDHWQLAAELGATAVHLGQEDLLALGAPGRAALRASGLALGISSHSVWELCRARTLAPRYIACGPVWPTTTKDMPWVPQGLDNLGWWCRMAGCPVVAIGGILQRQQVEATAAAGAAGICVLRGLGDAPQEVVPGLQEAFARGRAVFDPAAVPAWPHPTLECA